MDNPVDKFLAKTEVPKIIAELQTTFVAPKKIVSDVTDGKYQYVDLVQQGGGVWGIALVGYTYVLEAVGIRFYNLAGTSAGAINAMLLACSGNKEDERSRVLIRELLKLNLFDLVDGKKENWAFTKVIKKGIQKFVVQKKFVSNLIGLSSWYLGILVLLCLAAFSAGFISDKNTYTRWVGLAAGCLFLFLLALVFGGYYIFKRFSKHGYGLNEGNFFHRWLIETIGCYHIHADPTSDLMIKNMNDFQTHFDRPPPNLKVEPDSRRKDNSTNIIPQISIIASDITAERKIEFPRMWDLYWKDLKDIHPGDFVRASMSIPVFFETYTLHHIRSNSKLTIWQDHLNWKGKDIPEKEQFVDGGALSNFPIDVFANPANPVPRSPTFGIRLESSPPDLTGNAHETFAGYAGSIIGTMRANYDRDFMSRNRAFDLGVKSVMLKGHNWLNFFMKPEEQIEIFNCGARAAQEFLTCFDWQQYKTARYNNWVKEHTPNLNPNNY